MIDDWKFALQQWRDHGTKYLGGLAVVLGAMQALTLWFNAKELQLIGFASAVVGAFTMRRGFDNSRKDDVQ